MMGLQSLVWHFVEVLDRDIYSKYLKNVLL